MKSMNEFTQRLNLTKALIPGLEMEAAKILVQNQTDIFTQKIWECPEKIIWTNMVMTTEVLYAADLIPVNMELVAGWLATLGLSSKYISLSESMGFSSTLCSYHKAAIGICEKGDLPVPKGVVISSHICDGAIGTANHFERRYGANTFILNIPYDKNELSYEFVIQQYYRLIRWIETYTGQRFSEEKLIKALRLSNIAREYWLKAYELRKGEPLFQGHLSLRNLFGATFLFGSELGVEVSKAYFEQLYEMRKGSQEQLAPKHKKKRVFWIHFAPLYANDIMRYLEENLNCWIVFDITGYIYWPEHDGSTPVESLARKAMAHFYLGEASERRDLYYRLIKEFAADGIIHFMHNGCRAIPGSSWQIRQIADEMGLPYLELSGDCIDPRGFSGEQMKLRLEAFREALEEI